MEKRRGVGHYQKREGEGVIFKALKAISMWIMGILSIAFFPVIALMNLVISESADEWKDGMKSYYKEFFKVRFGE